MPKDFDIGRFTDKWFNDMPKLINKVAEIVKKDVEYGITYSEDIKGKSFKRLKSATIEAKRRKGAAYASRPLEDAGEMKKVYIKQFASTSKPEAVITMPANAQYGVYHNKGSGDLPLREWFGVSARAHKKIDKAIDRWVISH